MEAGNQEQRAPLIGQTIGSYRIESHVRSGGMGEVYRAWDERLQRPVAVKALLSSRYSDPISRARFLRETRLAGRVLHPYVATVLDVVESRSDLFLVMEYIEGQRFDEVFPHEGDPRLVLRYGLQIAEALAAIHEAHLVHRDLKPANVMITPAGHVKVLDFGIARYDVAAGASTEDGLGVAPTISKSGNAVGTLLYMSPEQLRAERVDARSDLFSMGVMLYQAVTGEHPFGRGSAAETVSAILNDPPGRGHEPQTLTRSGPLREIVLRLLEKKLEDRFQSATEVGQAFRDLAEARSSRFEVRRALTAARRPAAIGLAVVAVVALAIWGARGLRPRLAGGSPSRAAIAVLPFRDQTGERSEELRGEMIAALLAADLSESSRLRSLGHDRVVEILSSPQQTSDSPFERIARHARVDYVVAGSLFRQGDAYEAAVDVYGPDRDEPQESFRVTGPRLAGLVDLTAARLGRALFGDAGAGGDGAHAGEPNVPEPARALDYRAERALKAYRFNDAIRYLEQALTIAPEFVTAQARLADALRLAGYGERARRAADRAASLLKVAGAAPGSRLALETQATVARVMGQTAREVELREELLRSQPDDPALLLRLGGALRLAAEYDEALSVIERAIALDDRDPWSHILKARTLTRIGQQEAALVALEQADVLFRELGSGGGQARVQEVRGELARSREDQAAAAAAYRAAAIGYEAANLEVEAARARSSEANTCLVRGELACARSIYDRTLPVFRKVGDLGQVASALTDLGTQLYAQGQLEEAEALLRDAVVQTEELGNGSLQLPALSNLASLVIFTTRLSEGRALAERAVLLARKLEDWPAETQLRLMLVGVELQRGELKQAAESYRELVALQQSRATDATTRSQTLTGLAEVLQLLGQLAPAFESADGAVALVSQPEHRLARGYALLRRAYVLMELGDWRAAGDDLRGAAAAAGSGAEALQDLHDRLQLAAGALAVMQGRWTEAEPLLEAGRAAGAKSHAEGLETAALVWKAEIELQLGRPERAASLARQILATPALPGLFRNPATLALARALAASAQQREAAELATNALDRAQATGTLFPGAQAAALLVTLPASAVERDREAIRRQGSTLLADYRNAMPESRRTAANARWDLRAVVAVLETTN